MPFTVARGAADLDPDPATPGERLSLGCRGILGLQGFSHLCLVLGPRWSGHWDFPKLPRTQAAAKAETPGQTHGLSASPVWPFVVEATLTSLAPCGAGISGGQK